MIYYISKQQSIKDPSIEYISVDESLIQLNKLEWLCADTETSGLDRFIHSLLMLQLGDENNQFVIDLTTVDIAKYKELLESKNLILQNAKFDLQFLYIKKIIPRGLIWDTMLAEQVLYNGLDPEVNLAHLTSKYCKIALNKEERINFTRRNYEVTYDAIVYGAKDVENLKVIARKQHFSAKKKGVLKAIELENRFVKVLAYVEYCGIYLNRSRWIEKYSTAKEVLLEKTKALDSWVLNSKYQKYVDKQLDLFTKYDNSGKPIFDKTIINWASSAQVIPLFKDIGIDVTTDDKNSKSGESINAKILERQKHTFDIIKLYLEYQTVKKDFSTYGEKFLDNVHPVTGRIHPSFNQIMITSRLSCSKPNMQNLPADDRTRRCFTAEEGNILIDCDYKAQEDVVFVNNSMEPKMIEFYQNPGNDGHSYVAALCFPDIIGNTPNSEIKKKFPKLRQNSKGAKFSIHYGGTGYTIEKNLGLAKGEGDEIEKAYLTAFPMIHKHLEQSKANAKRNKFIITSRITGRKVWPIEYESMDWKEQQNFHKLACNYPIQTESAELTKEGSVHFFNWILENNYFDIVKIPNMVHDELLVEAPIEKTGEVGDNLKRCLELGAEEYCTVVPLTADVEVANHWVH